MKHYCMLAALLLPLLLLACSDDGDLAQELADRLSSALEFDDATEESGAPPEEHAGDASFPQVTALSAPNQLMPGEPFQLEISTDFANTGAISGVVIQVLQATTYIKVTAQASEPGMPVVIGGTLSRDDRLAGNAFSLRLALLDADGRAGNYYSWSTSVPRGEDDSDADTDADTDVEFDDCAGDYSALEWQDPPVDGLDALDWQGAVEHCQALYLDGSGWRLPTLCELRSLIRGCAATEPSGSCGAGDGCLSAGCWVVELCRGCDRDPWDDGCYWPAELTGQCAFSWSSSSCGDELAWGIDLSVASVQRSGKSDYRSFRCVR